MSSETPATRACNQCGETYPADAMVEFYAERGWFWCACCMALHRHNFEAEHYPPATPFEEQIRWMLEQGECARALVHVKTEVWH